MGSYVNLPVVSMISVILDSNNFNSFAYNSLKTKQIDTMRNKCNDNAPIDPTAPSSFHNHLGIHLINNITIKARYKGNIK